VIALAFTSQPYFGVRKICGLDAIQGNALFLDNRSLAPDLDSSANESEAIYFRGDLSVMTA